MSVLKIKDGNNWVEIPASGVGVPQGGNAGEVLTKASSTDYDAGWVLPLSMKLLWTNPNSMATFAAQTVSINLDGCDAVLILFRMANTTANHGIMSSICPIGDDGSLWGGYGNGSNRVSQRLFSVSNSGITFEGGYYNTSANNDVLIPHKIYGIKGIT